MKKLILLVVLVVMAYLWVDTDLSASVSLEALRQLVQTKPLQAAGWLFAVYVLVTALSLPAAAVLTLTAGAVFGFGWGLLLASFASTIGATLAFLVSRTLLRDWVQQRFSRYLESINRGVEKDGAFYLFSLRLIPVVPFFVINLVFGLTSIKVWPFYWVSQLGMLAGTAVYVNAGAELGALEELSLSGVMTPGLLGALLLLAIFPHLVRKLMERFQQHRIYRPFNRPKQFDANLVVIGGGSAGLVSALIAATVKAKVVLVERDKMGGDCLNTGCVPSKALIRSARVAHTINSADQFGLLPNTAEVDFPQIIERVERIIKSIEPHDSIERYTELGVECLTGHARIISLGRLRLVRALFVLEILSLLPEPPPLFR